MSTPKMNLEVILSANTSDFDKGMATAKLKAQLTAKEIKNANASMKNSSNELMGSFEEIGKKIAGAFAIGEVINFGKEAIKMADEAAKANKNLLFSVNGNTKAYNELFIQAEELRTSTGVDDESIKQIQQLAAGAGYSTERVKSLTSASIELSKKTGMDLQAAYLQLNTTLSGSVGRLKRLDPEFSTLTKEQLKNGAAIDLVNSKYGGFAENSLTNSERAKVAWIEFQKGVGGRLHGLAEELSGFAASVYEGITPSIKLSDATRSQKEESIELISAISGLNDGDELKIAGIKKLIAINPEYISGLDAQKLTQTELLSIEKDLNTQFEKRIALQMNMEKLASNQKEFSKNDSERLKIGEDISGRYMSERGVKSTNGLTVETMGRYLAKTAPSSTNAGEFGFSSGNSASEKLEKYIELGKKNTDITKENLKLQGEADKLDAKEKTDYEDLIKLQSSQLKIVRELKAEGKNATKANNDYIRTSNKVKSINRSLNSDSGSSSGSGDTTKKKIEGEKELQGLQKLRFDNTRAMELDIFALEETSEQAKINKWSSDEKTKTGALLDAAIDNKEIHKDELDAIKKEYDENIKNIDLITQRKIDAANLVGKMSLKTSQNNDSFGTANDSSNMGLVSIGDGNIINKVTGQLHPMAQVFEDATLKSNKFFKGLGIGAEITNETISNMSTMANGLGNLSSQFGEQTAAYKAFATAQVILSTIISANEYSTTMAWAGPIGIAIAQGLVYAMGAAQIAKINGVKFAQGGIVGGSSFSGDRVLAHVNSGEMVLNNNQQGKLFSMLNGGGTNYNSSTGGNVRFEIEGSKLVGVINNHNRRQGKIR